MRHALGDVKGVSGVMVAELCSNDENGAAEWGENPGSFIRYGKRQVQDSILILFTELSMLSPNLDRPS